jgi:hypothetical protein
MDGRDLKIATKQDFGSCTLCGQQLLADGCCPRYHIKKSPKRGRFSGKSKSVNKYNDYT